MPDRSLLLLRLLAAVAWADGEVSPEERHLLDGLAAAGADPAAALRELRAALETPLSRADFERYAREVEDVISDPGERRALIGHVERLIAADAKQAPREAAYLSHLRTWLLEPEGSAAGAREGSRGGILDFLQSAKKRAFELGSMATSKSSEVAARIGATLGVAAPAGGAESTREAYVTLFGALLHRVAFADGVVTPEEESRIRMLLSTRFGFGDGEVDRVLRLVHQKLSVDEERQRLCSEMNRITELPQRIGVVEALFDLARATGGPTSEEEEEIRLISNYLWVERQDFVSVRAASRARADS